MDANASFTRLDITHVARCPDVDPVLCYDEGVNIPEHRHDQGIAWLRQEPTLNLGFGGGWQAGVSAPYDVRAVRVLYTLPDGTPYAPPYEDIHHRDETLDGLVAHADAALYRAKNEGRNLVRIDEESFDSASTGVRRGIPNRA